MGWVKEGLREKGLNPLNYSALLSCSQTMSSINHLLEKADKIYRQQVSHRNDLDHLLVCLASGATFHSRSVRRRGGWE